MAAIACHSYIMTRLDRSWRKQKLTNLPFLLFYHLPPSGSFVKYVTRRPLSPFRVTYFTIFRGVDHLKKIRTPCLKYANFTQNLRKVRKFSYTKILNGHDFQNRVYLICGNAEKILSEVFHIFKSSYASPLFLIWRKLIHSL